MSARPVAVSLALCLVLAAAQCAAAFVPYGASEPFQQAPLPYRVFPIQRVLTDSECASLVSAARPSLAQSKVVNSDPSGPHDSEVVVGARTSHQAWLTEQHPSAGPAVASLLGAASGLTGVRRRDLLESVMVARYRPGEKYDAYHDACTAGCEKAPVYRRATLLVYLNDDFEGGTTTFPRIGFTAEPRAGSGVLFYNTEPETGAVIPESLHSGDPVVRGEKYIATAWVRFPPGLHGFPASPAPAAPPPPGPAAPAAEGEN